MSTLTTTDETARTRPLALDDLFAEQQTLTAVEEFARAHDDGSVPDQERYYKSLIPATPPGPGQQYAFEVDLDACSGCKACVVACHSLNGLAEDEAWRDVGLLHAAPSVELPVLQHVTTACHHCVEPGCLQGCPVNAYEKDENTGIVRHLDDQCFGCQYCTLMCPYEVPKYHEKHGIVRKCDMCADRLGAGEAPACVQACPHEAIKIRTVSVDAVRVTAAKAAVCDVKPRGEFAIPHSPSVDHTYPTTSYKTSRLDLTKVEPADLRTPSPAHAHGPLSVMLALTQVGVGGVIASLVAWMLGLEITSAAMKAVTLASFALVQLGLMAATLHLGRPHLAFRAVLGWRHSWLSREMLAFGGFMPLAIAGMLVSWCDKLATISGFDIPDFVTSAWVVGPVLGLAALSGLASVFTSVMIYVVTRKPAWSFTRTTTRFGLTTLVGATALLYLATLIGELSAAVPAAVALTIAAVSKIVFDVAILRHRGGDTSQPLVQSAELLTGPLAALGKLRLGLAAGGLVVALGGLMWTPLAVLGVGLLVAGEVAERWLFFTAATAPKMPGQVTTKGPLS